MIPPVIYTKIPETDPALVAQAAEFGVADLHEALGPVDGRAMLMSPRMRPLDPTLAIAGAAVTVFNYPGDNLLMHHALYLAQKGHVLVMTNGGSAINAQWGELAGLEAQTKGLAAGLRLARCADQRRRLRPARLRSGDLHRSRQLRPGPGGVDH